MIPAPAAAAHRIFAAAGAEPGGTCPIRARPGPTRTARATLRKITWTISRHQSSVRGQMRVLNGIRRAHPLARAAGFGEYCW